MDDKTSESAIVFNRCKSVDETFFKYDYGPIRCPRYEERLSQCSLASIFHRKIPDRNIVTRLIKRETTFVRPNVDAHYAVRRFHQNLVPNFTVVEVEKPPCFLRKFSPDGQHFISFSSDQTSIEIYKYKGCSAGENLLTKFSGEITDVNNPEYLTLRTKIWEQFFQLKHTVNVALNDEQLNRECSLFTDDGNYIIVGSAVFVQDEAAPPFFEIYRNNESVTPNSRAYLENYTLHLIDIKNGIRRDERTFKNDKIFLSHNQGVYLYQDFLCVLSVQQQIIHVFQATKEGYFINVRTIGRFCYDDDELLLASLSVSNQSDSRRPFRHSIINTLKHRILVFLYKRAFHLCNSSNSRKPMLDFYQNFDHFYELRMWKMQLLDKSHLMIKYASEDVITQRVSDPNTQPSFFVVYNMVTTEVLAVYENTSDQLLAIFENFCDYFRNAALYAPTLLSCSPSNTIYARTLQHKFLQTIISAKFGGQTEAIKRILAQIPISSQSYCVSPYLDLSLFSYDEKSVSVMERPKTCGDRPIHFYARDSGLLLYKIFAGINGKTQPPSSPINRDLVAFVYHPSDPFLISVHRSNADYIVNFHVRHVTN